MVQKREGQPIRIVRVETPTDEEPGLRPTLGMIAIEEITGEFLALDAEFQLQRGFVPIAHPLDEPQVLTADRCK